MNYLSNITKLPQGVVSYIRESRKELLSVQWPTKAETIRYTVVILAVSFAVAVATGAVDAGLTYAIQKFVLK
jgi:preprotein translocase SecE subunit